MDFGRPTPEEEIARLRETLLDTGEVKRWLGSVGGRAVHGRKDTNAETAMARLVEYGLCAGIPGFGDKMLPYVEMDDSMGGAFLIAAPYADLQALAIRFTERPDRMHETAVRDSYDVYL
jgi:hypothetical protein